MKTVVIMFICICIFAWNCSAVYAYTLTFDEFVSGTQIDYGTDYGMWSPEFVAVYHRASTWGLPHSGNNVMMWDGSYANPIGIYFSMSHERYDVYSVGAYFSTQPGAMVRITAYHLGDHGLGIPLTSVVIGATDQSWDNQYVMIDSSNGVFNYLNIEGAGPLDDDLHGFCADDMTVEPVPEPTSFAALAFGLVPIGAAAMRRRQR